MGPLSRGLVGCVPGWCCDLRFGRSVVLCDVLSHGRRTPQRGWSHGTGRSSLTLRWPPVGTAQLPARSRGHWRTISLGWGPCRADVVGVILWDPNLVLTHLPLHTATVSSAVASGLRLLLPSRRTRKSHLMGGSLWTRLRVPAPLCRWSCIAKRPNVVGLMPLNIDKTLVKKGLWYLRLQVRSSPKLINRRRC